MVKLNRWRRAALHTYVALCALVIYAWPRNKYEWMLDDPDTAPGHLSFCGLPVDPDAAWAPWFAFAPRLVLATLTVGLSLKRRRLHPLRAITGGLLLAWAGKFYLLAPQGC